MMKGIKSMYHFTDDEKIKIVSATKQIVDYLKTNIVPNIRKDIVFKMEVNPREYDLVFHIFPKTKKPFSVYRNAMNSTKYTLGNEFDYFDNNTSSKVDFFSRYEEMFCLINNWKKFKEICLEQVEIEKQNTNVLNEFQV